MVLDGHDGIRACEFAQKHLPSVLLRCDINERDENTIITAVKSAFMRTERDFFVRIDPQITRKLTLQIEINVSLKAIYSHSDHLFVQINGRMDNAISSYLLICLPCM